MNRLQVVEFYLERGDLVGLDSTHTVTIVENDLTGRMEAQLKRSIEHTPRGDRDVTGELTPRAQAEVERNALAQYERALISQPDNDWDTSA